MADPAGEVQSHPGAIAPIRRGSGRSGGGLHGALQILAEAGGFLLLAHPVG